MGRAPAGEADSVLSSGYPRSIQHGQHVLLHGQGACWSGCQGAGGGGPAGPLKVTWLMVFVHVQDACRGGGGGGG